MQNARLFLPVLATCLAASAAAQSERNPAAGARPTVPEEPEETPPAVRRELGRRLSVRETMTKPLVQRGDDGRAWVRTRDLRATLGADGLTVYPVFGRQASREWPVRFELCSVTRGDASLDASPVRAAEATPERLELGRASVREVYELDVDQIEQTFVFDELHGDGDLVVGMHVETELEVVDDGDVLRFVHESLGEMAYGRAFVLDSAGARQEIERTWNDGWLELRVPDSFLDRARFPVTIDPPLTGFSNDFGLADDAEPDVAFCGQTNEYLVCWQEYTSADNADVYLTSFDVNGNQGDTIAIDATSQYWRSPRIAYAYGPDRALIVASVNPDDLGGLNGSVRGVFVDPSAFATIGGAVTISTVGWDKNSPDVGGTNYDALANAHFCVVWSRELANGNSRVEYRVVDWDGSFVTDIVQVTDDVDDCVQTTISAGLGDVYTTNASYWTIAWILDEDHDGRGLVRARRVLWNGDPAYGGGNFPVYALGNCANPTVTSQLDETLESETSYPSIVAFDCRYPNPDHPSGHTRSILAQVVGNGSLQSTATPVTYLEDFDPSLDQWRPSIATDGTSFFLSYCEEWWSGIGSENCDVYMVTGNVVEDGGLARLALQERHQALATGIHPDFRPRLCTRWDGEASTKSDHGACVWVEDVDTVNGWGKIRGHTFEAPSLSTGDVFAVGVQYCDATPNSVGSFGGRNSSWLCIMGNGSVGSMHQARAVDLPLNQFGYLLASQTTGNLYKPAGSQGRLCLGGDIGRFRQQVQDSGLGGTILVDVDPQSIPQPLGPVAALPGESWHFQLWHRDIVNATQTSNFTNACTVVFRP